VVVVKIPQHKHAADLLFVLRPALLPPVWTIFLLGAGTQETSSVAPSSGYVGTAFLVLSLLFGAVYVLNQYFDIETDRQNHKLHFLPHGLIDKSTALVMYGVLTTSALVLAFVVSAAFGVIAASIVIAGVLYSAPPARLKDRAVPALLANATAHGSLVYLCGWVLSSRSLWAGVEGALPYFFAVGSIYILTTIPDLEGDRASGKNTLSVQLGAARAARWALGWYWASLLMAFYTVDLLFVLAALPLAYLFVKAGNGEPKHAIRAVRWAVGTLSIGACILFPTYALVLISGFVITRLYYRWRFDLAFP
jgi:4-hydroxybenzoate polyprenyltransferase